MTKGCISVIIPVYNSEKTVIPVINAIVRQSEKDIIREVIIVDDGSTDASNYKISRFLETYNGKIEIKLIRTENRGVSSARNRGMEESAGEWVAFCDSDDLWLEDKIEHQYNIIKTHENIDFLGGYVFDGDFRILGKKFTGTFRPTLKQMLLRSFPWPSTVIMKKNIYEELGGFENGKNHGEDMLYFIMINKKYNFYFDTKKICEIGFGKRPFGESGLSGDLNKMYEGTVDILNYVFKNKYITRLQWVFFQIFYYLKHIRRVILAKSDIFK